jgi:flagellin
VQSKALITDATTPANSTLNETGDASNDLTNWTLSGTEIGFNTDDEGRMYVSVEQHTGLTTMDIVIYKDSDRSIPVADSLTAYPNGITAALVGVPTAIQLDDVQIDTDGDGAVDTNSGMGGFVTLNALTASTSTELRPRLGARMYTDEYGADKYARVQATKGKMWEHWNKTTSTYDRVDSTASAVTVQANGQDASVAINGTDVLISGLEASVTTPVFSGNVAFNEGSLFNATIAQTGYGNGNASSRIGDFFSAATVVTTTGTHAAAHMNLAVNAGEDSASNITDINNGMQFQLGETDGDQSRTVYGIPSMGAPTIGQVTIEGETYTLQDVLGGGTASLSKDPIIAMKVINQAINDVSELRARLGAFQKNTLQTNINSLNVTIENVTMTESAIRDADMAYESTEFTRNQILVQAGTAMLAQANTVSQNVLQLLG